MLDSKEIWKDLKGFEGIYQVSNLGRVKSLSRVVRCNKGTTRLPEKIMKGQLSTVYGACNGYHLLKGHKVAYG